MHPTHRRSRSGPDSADEAEGPVCITPTGEKGDTWIGVSRILCRLA